MPEISFQLVGSALAVSWITASYGAPVCAAGNFDVRNANCHTKVIEIVRDAVCCGDPESTTWNTTGPDTASELVPGTADATTVTYAGTSQPGIYVATPKAAPGSSAAPSSSAASGASAGPVATPEASPGASQGGAGASPGASAPPDDPMAPVRFAVDLFDVGESTIAPGSPAVIEALGVGTGTGGANPSAVPGGSPAPAPATSPEPATSRDELWIPIVLLVLVALCVEWALYHRDTLVRIRRGLGARLGRQPAEGRG